MGFLVDHDERTDEREVDFVHQMAQNVITRANELAGLDDVPRALLLQSISELGRVQFKLVERVPDVKLYFTISKLLSMLQHKQDQIEGPYRQTGEETFSPKDRAIYNARNVLAATSSTAPSMYKQHAQSIEEELKELQDVFGYNHPDPEIRLLYSRLRTRWNRLMELESAPA